MTKKCVIVESMKAQLCSRKTSWGVDVHMDPHANSLMMKFTGLRRFGGGSWGEGGVGV